MTPTPPPSPPPEPDRPAPGPAPASQLPADVFAAIFHHAPDAVVIADAAGAVVAANQRAGELFGWTPAELAGRPVEALMHSRHHAEHAAHRSSYLADPTARPMGHGRYLWGLASDGRELPLEISLSPLQADDQVLVIAAIRDISDRLESAERLRRAERDRSTAQERERIARDLSDRVIQRLFAIGMRLEGARGQVEAPEVAARLAHAVDELDQTISEIRAAVFGLSGEPGA